MVVEMKDSFEVPQGWSRGYSLLEEVVGGGLLNLTWWNFHINTMHVFT